MGISDQGSDLVLSNNKEILVDSKSVYLSNWVGKGVISIKDLLRVSVSKNQI